MTLAMNMIMFQKGSRIGPNWAVQQWREGGIYKQLHRYIVRVCNKGPENTKSNPKFQVDVRSGLTIFRFSSLKPEEPKKFR